MPFHGMLWPSIKTILVEIDKENVNRVNLMRNDTKMNEWMKEKNKTEIYECEKEIT